MSSESPLERLRRLNREERRPATAAPRAGRRRRTVVGAIIGAIAFVLTKAKLVLLFLLLKGKVLLAALKAGPLLATISTMGVAAWAFAAFYGFPLAVGIVITILIHELGHGAAAKAMGLKVGAPVFIPLFGAVIALKEQPRSTFVEAVVGYGGPLAGTAAGLAAWCLADVAGDGHFANLLRVLAWFTFLINLFNLLPVFGLDGDRVTRCLRPWHWLPGGALLVAVLTAEAEWTGRLDPFVLFILLLGAGKAFSAWRRTRAGPEAERGRLVDRLLKRERYVEESDVGPGRRNAAAIAYFLLAAALPVLAILTKVRTV